VRKTHRTVKNSGSNMVNNLFTDGMELSDISERLLICLQRSKS